jgi:hypothetical protein
MSNDSLSCNESWFPTLRGESLDGFEKKKIRIEGVNWIEQGCRQMGFYDTAIEFCVT